MTSSISSEPSVLGVIDQEKSSIKQCILIQKFSYFTLIFSKLSSVFPPNLYPGLYEQKKKCTIILSMDLEKCNCSFLGTNYLAIQTLQCKHLFIAAQAVRYKHLFISIKTGPIQNKHSY